MLTKEINGNQDTLEQTITDIGMCAGIGISCVLSPEQRNELEQSRINERMPVEEYHCRPYWA